MREVRGGYWFIGRESEKIMRKGRWRNNKTGKQYVGKRERKRKV